MDFLKSHIFLAFLISITYFIVKNLLNKFYKNDIKNYNKIIFKDSILLFIICYLILIFKEKIFIIDTKKTDIFTNEAPF